MKCLCITGADQSDLEMIANVLGHAGMATPRPSKRDEAIDIAYWHEHVIAQQSEAAEDSEGDGGDSREPDAPGVLWEQLASDIFVANVKTGLWGWADTRSAALLDFWLRFETNLNFVLVTTTPERMLARAITGNDIPESVSTLIERWQEQHELMLRFYHRNPQRCLLLDADECAMNPAAFIKRCSSSWKLRLATVRNSKISRIRQDALAYHLAGQIVSMHPRISSLKRELAATRTKLLSSLDEAPTVISDIDTIVADYRTVRDRSSEQKQIESLQTRLAHVQEKFQDFQKEAETLRVQNEQHQVRYQHDHAALEAKLKDALKVNEELSLNSRKTQGELDALYSAQDSIIKQLDVENRARTSAEQEKSKLMAQLAAVQQEAISLSQDRDQQSRLLGKWQKQIEVLEHVKTELEFQIAELRVNPPRNQLQAGELDAALHQLSDVWQDNELFQLQLHQVQDELERIFLQYQNLQKQLELMEDRWQRMLQRNPEYCEYKALELVGAAGAGSNRYSWLVKDLSAAGRSFSEFRFDTILEDEIAGLLLNRDFAGPGGLLRWPAAPTENEILLAPGGTREQLSKRLQALLSLGPKDWRLLRALVKMLESALAGSKFPKIPTNFKPEALRSGLSVFNELLQRFPETLRYDQLGLKREQVNHDYEHLWFQIDNLTCEGGSWASFEFRLSCANVRPGTFGKFPKLEFPEKTSEAPFDSWFLESYDDFGAKLELRYAVPDSMDMAVWAQLSVHDKTFVNTLIAHLPGMLRVLQNSGIKLQRSWEDWNSLADELLRITSLCTMPAPEQAKPATVAAITEKKRPPAPDKKSARKNLKARKAR